MDASKHNDAGTARNQGPLEHPFVGELWERLHDGEVIVSATEIAPHRFRVAAFCPTGQEWAEQVAETIGEAQQLGDTLVRRAIAHECSTACGEWMLSHAPADWIDAPDAMPE